MDSAIKVKIYKDGTVGHYIGPCSCCGSLFQGHKRDYLCQRCDEARQDLLQSWEEVNTDGQAAYEGYCSSSEGKSLVSGSTLPPWSELPAPVKTAWGSAAKEVLKRRVDGNR